MDGAGSLKVHLKFELSSPVISVPQEIRGISDFVRKSGLLIL